ncbi:MAG: DNA replication/repair protein RecF [Actinomycetota bacterium]|nr:DNA replication/repair protein RecF [Actinomycetota bacterium]
MYIKKLELRNYRNYSQVNLDFDKNTILILGNNGNGKTNLLESICYLSTGRSHKTYVQDEIIKWGSDYSIIKALIDSGNSDKKDRFIEIELWRGSSSNNKIKVDKTRQKKKSDFTSILPSVIFSPDDLNIIKAGPSGRRDFLDSVLETIDSKYYRERTQYQKILLQRNSLIKSMSGNKKVNLRGSSTLEAWDDNIVKYGVDIIRKRLSLLHELKHEFENYMSSFFKEADVDIFYMFSWDRKGSRDSFKSPLLSEMAGSNFTGGNLKEIFYRRLKESREEDIRYKNTTVGPHRDDFEILINGKNARYFGSQGQQRIAAICLKLCKLDIIGKKIKRNPVLLLDDVFSELDIERRKLLVKIIKNNFQTFITATNISYIDKLDLDFGSKLLVKDNKITVLNL